LRLVIQGVVGHGDDAIVAVSLVVVTCTTDFNNIAICHCFDIHVVGAIDLLFGEPVTVDTVLVVRAGDLQYLGLHRFLVRVC